LRNVCFTGHFAQFWLGWILHLRSWVIWSWDISDLVVFFFFNGSFLFLVLLILVWEVINNDTNMINFFLTSLIVSLVNLLFLWLRSFRFCLASSLRNSWDNTFNLRSLTLNFINWFGFDVFVESIHVILAQITFLIETAARLTWSLNIWTNCLPCTSFRSLTSSVLSSPINNLVLWCVSIGCEIIFLFSWLWNNSCTAL
jgi:hypothetical protein